jgi:exopolyphosphatase / guanosine-5'-triphosphate,3'-diphosphate pyrophosphatase
LARTTQPTVFAAIDVGTNAVRLELARPLPDGSLEIVHQERDPVRPGEGVFRTGSISRPVADRLLSTLRRYGALCRRHRAKVRAVATSAVREARNRDEIVRRARVEAGIDLEVISGQEEARLICLGVLHGKPEHARSLVIDIGGGSTEVVSAVGDRPIHLWSVAIGSVRFTDLFSVAGKTGPKRLALMRSYAEEVFREVLPERMTPPARRALGSSGTINAVVSFAAAAGTAHATARQLSRAVDKLADLGVEERRQRFDPQRAEIILAGAVLLEAIVLHLRLESVSAVDYGLRDGLLFDLVRRSRSSPDDHSLVDATIAMGRRFHFDEQHAMQVTRLALSLFDSLRSLHRLPEATRSILEVAALLHDVGNAVSYQRHHKHSYYLIQNADLPGLTDRERELVARVARFHRRSPPERGHDTMESLTGPEFQMVRKLATLLRLADSFDRSHHQPVRRLATAVRSRAVAVRLYSKAPVDLEIWDAEREAALFRRVFRRPIRLIGSHR